MSEATPLMWMWGFAIASVLWVGIHYLLFAIYNRWLEPHEHKFVAWLEQRVPEKMHIVSAFIFAFTVIALSGVYLWNTLR